VEHRIRIVLWTTEYLNWPTNLTHTRII